MHGYVIFMLKVHITFSLCYPTYWMSHRWACTPIRVCFKKNVSQNLPNFVRMRMQLWINNSCVENQQIILFILYYNTTSAVNARLLVNRDMVKHFEAHGLPTHVTASSLSTGLFITRYEWSQVHFINNDQIHL